MFKALVTISAYYCDIILLFLCSIIFGLLSSQFLYERKTLSLKSMAMRHIFSLLSFLLLLQFTCFAQQDNANRNDSAKIIDAGNRRYDLAGSEKSTSTARLPFNKVSFNDVRYDTSFIAINWQVANNSLSESAMNKKYNLTGGLAPGLTSYINQYISNNFSNNNAELVCYIKRFAFALKDTSLAFFDPQERFNTRKT